MLFLRNCEARIIIGCFNNRKPLHLNITLYALLFFSDKGYMNPLLELGRLGEKAAWLIKLLMELKDWVLGVF